MSPGCVVWMRIGMIRTDSRLQVTSISQLNTVIFKDKAAAPFGRKFVSLFPGLGYAAGYKVGATAGARDVKIVQG
jgi:hypothetical protein